MGKEQLPQLLVRAKPKKSELKGEKFLKLMLTFLKIVVRLKVSIRLVVKNAYILVHIRYVTF